MHAIVFRSTIHKSLTFENTRNITYNFTNMKEMKLWMIVRNIKQNDFKIKLPLVEQMLRSLTCRFSSYKCNQYL